VALVSRIDKIVGLFCKRAPQKRLYSAKETYNLLDPTHRSHPIISKYLSKAYFVVVIVNMYHGGGKGQAYF